MSWKTIAKKPLGVNCDKNQINDLMDNQEWLRRKMTDYGILLPNNFFAQKDRNCYPMHWERISNGSSVCDNGLSYMVERNIASIYNTAFAISNQFIPVCKIDDANSVVRLSMEYLKMSYAGSFRLILLRYDENREYISRDYTAVEDTPASWDRFSYELRPLCNFIKVGIQTYFGSDMHVDRVGSVIQFRNFRVDQI